MNTPMTAPLTEAQRALVAKWYPYSQKFAMQWINRGGLRHHEAAARSTVAMALVMASATWRPRRSSFKTWATLYMRAQLHKMRAQETGAVRRRLYKMSDDVSLNDPVRNGSSTTFQDNVESAPTETSIELALDIARMGPEVLDGIRAKLADCVPRHKASGIADASAAAFLSSIHGATLQDIGIELGVSRERARQYVMIGAQALERYGSEVRGEVAPSAKGEKRKPPRRYTKPKLTPARKALREEAVRRYVAGESASKVGAVLKVAGSSVCLWVREAGHPVRGQGGDFSQHNQGRNAA